MLIICSISHFLNDMIQSIIPSIYPIVKDKFDFSFAQIGIITLVFQMTSSILQPLQGLYATSIPVPMLFPLGMCFTLVGLLLLAFAEELFSDSPGCERRRSGLIRVSSHSFKSGTDGIGRQEESGTIYLSGGRQWRIGSRSAAGCHHHPAFRTACHLLVCPCSPLAAIIMVRLGVWYRHDWLTW